MHCKYQSDCPFFMANGQSPDPFVQRAIEEYCRGGRDGCAHREAKEEYDTFLALNVTPDNTLLTA